MAKAAAANALIKKLKAKIKTLKKDIEKVQQAVIVRNAKAPKAAPKKAAPKTARRQTTRKKKA